MQWLIDNKEWVFSGAGIFAISVIAGWFLKKRTAVKQKQKSGSNSTNYQAGGDIKIGKHDD